MDKITVEGVVPETFSGQKEFYLKVSEKDLKKTEEFISKTNTTFRAGGIAVRKKDIVENCRAGDTILLTIGIQKRVDGLRLISLDYEKKKC